MEKPELKDDKGKDQEENDEAKNKRPRDLRIPLLNLERAREYVPPASPTEKTASDSEMLIISELPNIGQPDFSFSPVLEREDSPKLKAPSALSDEAVQQVLQGINSWTFDIFQLDDDSLPKMVEKIFRELGLFDNFPLDVKKVRAFTNAMVMRYQPNPYHNFRHACDVLHAVYLILTLVDGRKKLSHLEVFALALAALCHDVDHPGLTNAFLVATYDPLALRYNDRAVLESHHAATCFITMRGNDSLNLLAGLSEEEQRHMRKLMIVLILATDMGEHARILREVGERVQDLRPFEQSPFYTPPGCLSPILRDAESSSSGNTTAGAKSSDAPPSPKRLPDKVYKNPLSPSPPIQSTSDVMLLIQLIIKCADISNVVKPFFLSKRWAALLLLEWFRQGEIEKQLGLPISKFMDREDPSTLMAMTCGCIDYIAKPMYEVMTKLLPRMHENVLVNLNLNRQMWSTFSTNGRRASETAQQILGPFAPPPIPKGEAVQEGYQQDHSKLEGKLVATFSGQYVSSDVPSRKLESSPSAKSLGSVSEDSEETVENVEDSPILSVTDRSSEFSRLGSEAGSSVKTSPQFLSRAGTEAPSSPQSPLQASQEQRGSPSPGVQYRLSPRGPGSPSVPVTQISGNPESPGYRETYGPGGSQPAAMEVPFVQKSPHEPVAVDVDVATSQQSADVIAPLSKPQALQVKQPVVPTVSRGVHFDDSELTASERSELSSSIQSGSSPDLALRVSFVAINPDSDSVKVLIEQSDPLSTATIEQRDPDSPRMTGLEPFLEEVAASSSESKAEPETEDEYNQRYEAPLSLLFGAPTREELMLPAKIGKDKNASLVSALLPGANNLVNDRKQNAWEQMAFRSPSEQAASRGSILTTVPSFANSDGDLEKSSSLRKGPPPGFWEALRTHPRVNRLNRALESKTWNALLIVATLVALFADDVVKGFLPKHADVYESHILTACLSLFLAESALLCIFRDRYFFSFFFWLDMLGSVSLVPLVIGITAQNLVIARTGRAAKTVTRFSKTLQASHIQQQIVHHIPVLRVFKFFGFKRDSTLESPDYEEEEKFLSKPSQLWSRLAELTSQKLILGVLIIMILTPYFNNSEKDLAPLVSLDPLDDYLIGSPNFNLTVERVINMTKRHGYNLLYLGVKASCRSIKEGGYSYCLGIDVAGVEKYQQILPNVDEEPDGRQAAQEEFRPTELISVTSDSSRAQAYYSIKKKSRFKYGMNIAMTVLILLLLAAWCFFLSRDSNRLLIQPIERMVQFVKELAEDPVSFAGKTVVKPTGDSSKIMETFYVEAALVKIASLTKVALGDAGMDILSVNLKGSEFNPMLPGKKIRACFGFCDIRNFTDATECLQEDVMMFVNRIADVVHNKVVLHSGFPNKNIGDAFLIVWKKTVSDNTNKSRATSFADRALRAFLDIIQSIETSQSLAEFAKHPAIQKRMPGYRIHMGFGLHVGWAIEGAIGSAHKVDPSYLSPHVNMASRLEAATKQYGVMLLISETVIAHLTKSTLRDSCRKLDRVTVKGSQDPMVLYTFDIPLFQQDLRGNPQEYRDIFEEAVDSYIDGDWDIALERLQECQTLWPTDKPATVLLTFMASHNNIAPENWAGFRELTEK
ncbi:protein MpCAPE [Marchantia polymorpha subsp. ruderalis]